MHSLGGSPFNSALSAAHFGARPRKNSTPPPYPRTLQQKKSSELRDEYTAAIGSERYSDAQKIGKEFHDRASKASRLEREHKDSFVFKHILSRPNT